MGKEVWKPGNMLYPVPVVMVTAADKTGAPNIITVAWTGTVCSDPAMVSISVRPERFSYHMIEESGEFALNLTTRRLLRAADWCGVKSGRDVDKFRETGLTADRGEKLALAPVIRESPVNIECRVEDTLKLGSHHMFLARVLCVQADRAYLDPRGKLDLNRADLVAYSHGEYMALSEKIGSFGYSVAGTKRGV